MPLVKNEDKKLVKINRRKSAKRFTLRVCQNTGKINLTIPLKSSLRSAENFVEKNAKWISSQLKQVIPREYVSLGTSIPIEGVDRLILPKGKDLTGSILQKKQLFLECDELDVGLATKKFLLNHAVYVLTPIFEENAAYIKENIKSIRFKDTKSRWGSCSSEGSLMVSWRLIMAPPSVYRYVIIHEIAHLRYMNHGDEFWTLVKKLHPFYLNDRFWLKKNGKTLNSFVFDAAKEDIA